MSNVFKLCRTHFSRRGENFSRGLSSSLRPPSYGPDAIPKQLVIDLRENMSGTSVGKYLTATNKINRGAASAI